MNSTWLGRMRASMLVVWLGLATAVPGPVACAQDAAHRAGNSQVVIELLQKQAAAWNAGDLEAFMSTYWRSDELTFSSGGRTTRGWDATLARYRQRYPDRAAMGQLSFRDLEVTLLGEDAALVLGNWQLTREADRPEGNFSLVLRWIDARWQIVHDHTSLRLAEGSNK